MCAEIGYACGVCVWGSEERRESLCMRVFIHAEFSSVLFILPAKSMRIMCVFVCVGEGVYVCHVCMSSVYA